MRTIKELSILLEKNIKNISFPDSPSTLYEPITYIMGLKGKRMRPLLVLMAYQLFGKNLNEAIEPALAIEFFHNFTLLHDDIMDKAPLRRGNLTVHEKWNDNIAILSGDTMMIQAYKLISGVDRKILNEILDIFNQAATQVCEGQQWDMDFETNSDVKIDQYLKMIEYKTAVLLAASLQIGGLIARATKQQQQDLYHFGLNMGIAFQLKDDLLDTFGDPKFFGKQPGGDIMANKKTYLYLKSLSIASSSQVKDLKNYFSNNHKSNKKVQEVTKIFKHLEVDNLTIELMKQYHKKAMSHLDAIESKNKSPLLEFSSLLLDRVV